MFEREHLDMVLRIDLLVEFFRQFQHRLKCITRRQDQHGIGSHDRDDCDLGFALLSGSCSQRNHPLVDLSQQRGERL